MSRNIELERILQGWFEWEHCPGDKKDERRRALHKLLDEQRAGTNVSRQELIVALSERYREFRTVKEKESRTKLSRLR